ncbi:MAG: hypothetical protein AAGB03_02655 [Pseudomonadota bacterium]
MAGVLQPKIKQGMAHRASDEHETPINKAETMHTEGLRRKKLSILKKRKFDLRAEINAYGNDKPVDSNPRIDDLSREERDLDRTIGVLHCARLDLL